MENRSRFDEKKIIVSLVDEVVTGKVKRDHLINAANDFAGQTQALYFSNARRFLQSGVSAIVMKRSPDLSDLALLYVVE